MNYYFKMNKAGNVFSGSFTSSGPRALNRSDVQILIAVTEEQYGDGSEVAFSALASQVVVDGISAAKTEAADYALWQNDKLRAIIKLMVVEINKLRQELSLTTYNKTQIEAALKAEM
jgi:hypothetical protein